MFYYMKYTNRAINTKYPIYMTNQENHHINDDADL